MTDNIASITAIANDLEFADVFSAQLRSLAKKGDILIVISGSGNSQNLIKAVQSAKKIGASTIGFLGMDGGKLKTLVDIPVIVDSSDYGPIEDIHLVFDHLITAYLKEQ